MHIIVEDRRANKPLAGDTVSEAECVRLASVGQVYTMPVDPEFISMGALAGFFRKDFGRGASMSDALPGMVCRLALFSQARPSVLHWRARITCTEAIRKEATPEEGGPTLYAGTLRLVSDTSQGFQGGTVSSTQETTFNFGSLLDDKHDGHGWVVGGSARFNPRQDGVYGFALHGVGRGFRVLWAALTQTG